MSFQADIGNQFEFTQKLWANNSNFVAANTGIDPLIGQGSGDQTHRAGWNDPAKPAMSDEFGGFVTLKGGEYFFAASLSFLSAL